MKVPKTPLQQSALWRLWHSGNLLLGGTIFVAGSVLLLPHIDDTPTINSVSVWFYVIGSLTLLLADITELIHFFSDWRYLVAIINRTFNVVSTFLYLLGSILLLPVINMAVLGMQLYIVGSFLLTSAQVMKIVLLLKDSQRGVKQTCRQNMVRISMLLMSAMGGVLFIVGTYVFLAGLPGLITFNVRVGAWMFIIGSLFFMIPGMYLVKVYFCSKKREVTLLDSIITL